MKAEAPALGRVRTSFARQPFMATLGATLLKLEPGAVTIGAEDAPGLRQQHRFIHGGVLMTLADSAAGYAAMTLVPPDAEVLTTELKVNFLRPATGAVRAEARVIRAGQRLTVCAADVFAGPDRVHVATALGSFAVLAAAS